MWSGDKVHTPGPTNNHGITKSGKDFACVTCPKPCSSYCDGTCFNTLQILIEASLRIQSKPPPENSDAANSCTHYITCAVSCSFSINQCAGTYTGKPRRWPSTSVHSPLLQKTQARLPAPTQCPTPIWRSSSREFNSFSGF